MCETLLGPGHHDGDLARTHPVDPCHTGGTAPEPHARKIVPWEDRMDLGGAGRHDDAPGMHTHELPIGDERHLEPLVDTQRGVPVEDGHLGHRTDLRLDHPDTVEGVARRDRGADRRLVADEDACTGGSGVTSGLESRGPRADDE